MNQSDFAEQSANAGLTTPISASTVDSFIAPGAPPAASPEDSLISTPAPVVGASDTTAATPAKRRCHSIGQRLAGRPIRLNVRVHTLDSLHDRDYRLLWLSTLFLSGGRWVHEIVIGWLTYILTRDPLLTALALGLAALPFLVAAPVGGILADRLDRRKFLVVTSSVQGVMTAAFSALVVWEVIETWHIFAFALAMGFSWAISDPTRVAMLPNIVPRQSLVNAFALNGLAFNLTRLAVPASAGLLIASLGPGPTLLVGAALYLGAAASTARILLTREKRRESQREKALSQIVEAARYVRREPVVLALILLGALPLLLVIPFVQGLLPVYAPAVFDVGPAGLGLMMSALGVGATVGAFIIASLGNVARRGRVLLLGLALAVGAMAAFSFAPSLSIALLILMVLTGALTSYFTLAGATLQAMVPDSLRGRVAALWVMTFGVMPLGSLLAGGLARLAGAPSATLISAFVMAALLVALSPKLVRVWRLE